MKLKRDLTEFKIQRIAAIAATINAIETPTSTPNQEKKAKKIDSTNHITRKIFLNGLNFLLFKL